MNLFRFIEREIIEAVDADLLSDDYEMRNSDSSSDDSCWSADDE